MKRMIATLVLGLAAPLLLLGQAPSLAAKAGTPPHLKPSLLGQQRASLLARAEASRPWLDKKAKTCEPGPVTGVFSVQDGWCEGIAVARQGDVYTADSVTGNVYRVTPRGEARLFANLYPGSNYDPTNPVWFFEGPKGLGFSREGDLWVCNPCPNGKDPAKHGLWKIDREGRAEQAVPLDPEAVPFPNGLTFDPHGNLYFTESWMGGVWKVERGQSTASLWLAHELLASPYGGFGANGIAYKDGAIFVANTDQVTLVKIPVNEDGTAGSPGLFASGFGWPDGLTVGPNGDLHAIGGWDDWQLIRFADNGSWEILVPAGMTGATSLEFGKTHQDKYTLYMSNFNATWTGLQSLLKVELCKPSKEN